MSAANLRRAFPGLGGCLGEISVNLKDKQALVRWKQRKQGKLFLYSHSNNENPAVLSNVVSPMLKDRCCLLQHLVQALCWPCRGGAERGSRKMGEHLQGYLLLTIREATALG